MTSHFILEIDEGSLSLAVAEIRRKSVHVLHNARITLSSMEGSALVFALHDLLKDQDKKGAQVHVVLSDPNVIHFDLQVPRLERSDLEMVFEREARRLGSIPDEEDVLLGSRQIQKVKKGSWRHAVVAIPDHCIEPIRAALRREGLEIQTLSSVEEAAVRVLPDSLPGTALYVDHGAGRVRLVYVEDGVITQRRHVLAPGIDEEGRADEDTMSVDQLSMEIGWSLDYLREMGKCTPEAMILSMDLELTAEQIDKIRGPMIMLDHQDPRFDGPGGALSQATQGVLDTLTSGCGIQILGKHQKVSRIEPRMLLATMLSVVLCITCIAATGWIFQREGVISQNVHVRALRLEELRMREVGLDESLEIIERKEQRDRLRQVLSRRRPFSMFLAQSCNAVPAGINLVETRIEPDGQLYLRGRALGPDRLGSLDLVKAYRQGLQELPFLEEVRERVERFEGQEAWLDFLIVARWREAP